MARLNVPVDRDPTDLCDEYADASEPRTEFPVGCVPGTIPPPPAAPEPEPCILGVLVSEAAVCGPSEHGNVAKFGSCVASNTNPSLRLLECRGAVDFGHRVVPCDELMLAPGLTLEVSAELVRRKWDGHHALRAVTVMIGRCYAGRLPRAGCQGGLEHVWKGGRGLLG